MAHRIKVADLKPGMVTPDWTVVGEPHEEPAPSDGPEPEPVLVVRMRHRVDGGESDIYYAVDAETTVIEEDEGELEPCDHEPHEAHADELGACPGVPDVEVKCETCGDPADLEVCGAAPLPCPPMCRSCHLFLVERSAD